MSKYLRHGILFSAAVTVVVLGLFSTAQANRGDGALGVIYVRSQGLFFDTFVTAEELPPHGPFQDLEPGGPMGANGTTDFGPGDPGYKGGRWRAEDDDGEVRYFLCPLLGPGRELP
jgi:hypothetical protein